MSSGDRERLHKRIASAGICSRRAAEGLILEGRVRVNGEIVTEMGVKVGPDDLIEVDGQNLSKPKLVYVLLNKPAGYVTTMDDPQRRRTVMSLIPDVGAVVKPVGRLDMDTEGVLLLTNDGDLAQRLTHPRYQLDKVYQVRVVGAPGDQALERLEKGVYLEDGKTGPAKVSNLYRDPNGRFAVFELTLHEGRNRQVRRMCEAVGHPVESLKRLKMGPLNLKRLPKGACRILSQVEIRALRRAVKLP